MAEEQPLHLFVNKTFWATILCSPYDLKALAIGHLLSEGIIKSTKEIQDIILDKENSCFVKLQPKINIQKRISLSRLHQRVVTSACGGQSTYQFSRKPPEITSKLKVNAEVVIEAVKQLNFTAKIYRRTGGVHAAALYNVEGLLEALAEDVGRHNAVDKVIGIAASKELNLSDLFLTSTGRLSGDIVFKAAKVGIPIVASLGAALDSGTEMAKTANLTLAGFVRGKRMNIYSCPDRIIA
ncbi:MAG: formate dehydrogenase accessory sulfurtransferase FdhD [Candidatus Bathyarchaeota archaeon]|nr:formate dehydrogenase accessory sulfurtransferase FdhD [Candidatus Bathyarchaeota archaeon]